MSIKLIPYIRRRVPGDILLYEFYDSLEKSKEWFEKDYNKNFEVMSLTKFINVTLSMTIDGIHWILMDSSPDDAEWYDHAFEGLKEFFGGKLKKEYNKLIEKNGLLPLNEEEDFQEDEVLKETKIQKVVESYIEKIIKDKELPESFIEFKTFTLNDNQTPISGSKLLYVFPIFEESFGNTPYEEWEIIEKLLWSKNGLHTKLEAAFAGLFDKVQIKPIKTPENYIKTIKSLSKFGNRI